ARRTREGEVGDRLVHRAGQHVDDAAATLTLHVGDGFAAHAREEDERALHGGGPLLLGGRQGPRPRAAAGGGSPAGATAPTPRRGSCSPGCRAARTAPRWRPRAAARCPPCRGRQRGRGPPPPSPRESTAPPAPGPPGCGCTPPPLLLLPRARPRRHGPAPCFLRRRWRPSL